MSRQLVPLSSTALRVLRTLAAAGRVMTGAELVQTARIGWGRLVDVLSVLERRGYVRVSGERVAITRRGLAFCARLAGSS